MPPEILTRTPVRAPRLDWQTERDQIDLAAVVTGLLGPALGRRGEHGRRLWWPCPLHQDRNPSFCVTPGSPGGSAMAVVPRGMPPTSS